MSEASAAPGRPARELHTRRRGRSSSSCLTAKTLAHRRQMPPPSLPRASMCCGRCGTTRERLYRPDTISASCDLRTPHGEAVSRASMNRLAPSPAAGGRYLWRELGRFPGPGLPVAFRPGPTRTTISLPIERFQWFVGGALALALLATAFEWRALTRWRRAPALVAVIAVALAVSACATAAYDLNERALQALDEGDLDAAIELLYEAQAEDPQDGQIALNLAAALHQAERYERGRRIARRALAIATWHRHRRHSSLGTTSSPSAAREALKPLRALSIPEILCAPRHKVVYRLLHPERRPSRKARQPRRRGLRRERPTP